jgi:hypothetical protein
VRTHGETGTRLAWRAAHHLGYHSLSPVPEPELAAKRRRESPTGGYHDLTDQNPASPGTLMAASLNRDIVIPPFARFPVLASGLFLGRGASRGRVAGTCCSSRFFYEIAPIGAPRTVRIPVISSLAAPKNSEWWPVVWDSFGTVGLVPVHICVRILGNWSRGVAQPGSAPALGEYDSILSLPSRSTLS